MKNTARFYMMVQCILRVLLNLLVQLFICVCRLKVLVYFQQLISEHYHKRLTKLEVASGEAEGEVTRIGRTALSQE